MNPRQNKSFRLIFVALLLCLHVISQAQQRPKIGLTLSGGGARGLAHIGILEAIDSAGLKIDYLTGTSMGSIIGGLYAMGYSGDTIEVLAKRMDWNALFSNQPNIQDISYEEKKEYNKYIIEIPFEFGKPKLASGVITGQALWLELAKLCWPAKDQKNFSGFNIPFKCIATDVATGEIVTLDSGEIVTSMRASMAIPSIFTAVSINGRKLVDGGVVRNFPVITAKEMGADIVIGSNVSGGLRKSEHLVTPIDILYQLGFYKDAVDFEKERKECDIYVSLKKELEPYTAASFGSVDSIIEAGKRVGREMYPVFKHLADSLNALAPGPAFVKNRLPFSTDIELSSIHVKGLVHSDEKFFIQRLRLRPGGCYTSQQLRDAVQNVYGTRFYKVITYELTPEGYGQSRMDITVEENALTSAKFALNYNSLTNAMAIVNLTQRNFITKNSRSFVTLGISENPRLQAEYFKYLGGRRNFGLGLNAYYENNGINFYDESFNKLQSYRNKFAYVGMDVQFTFGNTMAMGATTRWEYIKYLPQFSPYLELRGSTNQLNSFIYFGVNSLDRKIYPSKGMLLDFKTGYIYNQHSGIRVNVNGQPVEPKDVGIDFQDFMHAMIKAKYYLPTGDRSSITANAAGAVNFGNRQTGVNTYFVGGMTDVMYNQIPFVGLYEGEVITTSIAAMQLGWQWEVLRNIFAMPKVGAAVYDLNASTSGKYKYLSGYGLGAGYSSRLGPIEATMMYSDQVGKLRFYVNIGYNF
ncbi:MAG: patatin-like phospholipase family protein [Chitinophaga sp.]|uniref:patatin-like phospholipase family protein n=1 Tax=Chitinophaga sp. TaxID=1869181 RepID=UPI0025BBB576|nr:patatin-like phospholipase family protein [Chitinophaga sp.]MBV8251858.1 patatin-like phospholipase family protein [Chitinophaga sp.]